MASASEDANTANSKSTTAAPVKPPSIPLDAPPSTNVTPAENSPPAESSTKSDLALLNRLLGYGRLQTAEEIFKEKKYDAIQKRASELVPAMKNGGAAFAKAQAEMWRELSDEEREGYEKESSDGLKQIDKYVVLSPGI